MLPPLVVLGKVRFGRYFPPGKVNKTVDSLDLGPPLRQWGYLAHEIKFQGLEEESLSNPGINP